MSLGSGLSITALRTTAGVRLTLDGVIDESLDAGALREHLKGRVVAVDLGGVQRITSPGVREWKRALTGAAAGYIGLVNCRPVFVNQLNWVREFSGAAQLVSFYLPYACEQCSAEFERLLDLREKYAEVAALEAPVEKCPQCGAEAPLDALPSSYLHFAAAQPKPTPPPTFDAVVQGTAPRAGPPGLKLNKLVEGAWTALSLEGTLDDHDYFRRAEQGIEGPVLLSLRGVDAVQPGGAARLFEFARRLEGPVVVDAAPVELLEAWARAGGHPGVRVLTARGEFLCPLHGAQVLRRTLAQMRDPDLECEQCGQRLSAAFAVEALDALPFPPAQVTPELSAVQLALETGSAAPKPATTGPKPGELGSVVLSRYVLLRQLGVGGMAEAILAKSTAPGGFERLHVVKRALPHLRADQAFIEMFLAEARIAARVNHPNVVQIYDVGRDGDEYFIIMEYVNGSDLSSLIKRARAGALPCPVGVAARITAGIAHGLHAAHAHVDEAGVARPIVHRDVSPHNVLVSFDGHVRLTDFGIARVSSTVSHTPTSMWRGKVGYLAPEVIKLGTKHGSSPSVDVFATGIVLYQLLTGSHPFTRDSDAETLSAILHDEVILPSRLRSDVPPTLDIIVAEALARDPAQRTPSAGQLATKLEAFMAESRSPGTTQDVATWVSDVAETLEPDGGEPPAMGTNR